MFSSYWERKRISRRRLLRNAALGGGAIAAAGLVGCGDDDNGATATPSPDGTATASPTAAPTTPVQLGTLRVAAATLGDQVLDPVLTSQSNVWITTGPIFDWLVEADKDRNMVPGIAESWEMLPDGSAWIFKIRQGVKFHNGDDLTGEDVKFSLERFMSEESKSSNSGPLRSSVDTITVPDPYTVRINMKQPNITLHVMLSVSEGQEGAIMPMKYFDSVGADGFKDNPVGSGPWRLTQSSGGESVEFEALESHWRKAPNFKNLSIREIPEETSRLALLERGDVDLSEVSPDRKSDAEGAGLQVFSIPMTAVVYPWYFGIDVESNAGTPAATDVRVRKALQLSIDGLQIMNTLHAGEGGPPSKWIALPYTEGYDPTWQPDPYDPEAARELLAEAGLSDGFDIEIYAFGLPGAPWLPTVAEAVGSFWQEIGVRTKIVPIEYATLSPLWRGADTPDPSLIGDPGLFRVSPGIVPTGLQWANSQGPLKLFRRPELDAKIDAAFAELDPEQRSEQFRVLIEEVHDLYGNNAMYHVNSIFAAQQDISNWRSITGWAFASRSYEYLSRTS